MSNQKQKTFVIIDGNAIVHRAYHALPPLTAKDGTMVNAVYGFTSMLLKVLNDLKPDYMAVSFDVAGGSFRDSIFTEYKATRVKADQELYDQIPLCHQVVQTFGIPIFEKKGFEADDIIGTIVSLVTDHRPPIKSIVVSGDMDLLQLVEDEKIEVYLLRKGMSDFHLYNEKAVEERFSFGPERIVDYKSLRGDSSDNIPGVKGIGEKTAAELIKKIGGLEEIYRQLDEQRSTINDQFKPGVIAKLNEGKDGAFMSHELATIKRDVPDLDFKLEDCAIGEFDRDKLVKLFQKFEFYSLVKRIPGDENAVRDVENIKSTKIQKTNKKLVIVDKNNLGEILNKLKEEDVIACKEILSGVDVLTSDLLGLVFVSKRGNYYVEKSIKDVFELFSDKKRTIVGHDLKSLIKVLKCSSAQVLKCQLFDIMVASHLLNSSTRAHDLGSIVLRELEKELSVTSNQVSLFGTDPAIVANELQAILEIYEIYKKKLEDEENVGLFSDIEMALVPVLAEMELNGVAIDEKMLHELSVEVNKEIQKLEKKIWEEAGEEFNVASSVQLRDILFDKMQIPHDNIKKGKTGLSTAASELEKLHGVHPIIEHIEDYRELEKLRNTYIDVLPTLVNKKTERIHSTFNQAVTTTGRLSSSEPNLQNIPIRTDYGRKVREAFIAEPGNVLVVADYSQIELRVVASLAKDKTLIDIFNRGEDVHTATAAVINGVPFEMVTKEMRSAAKGVNFGVLYGMGSYGLSSRTGITQWEAKDFIKKYFENFKDVKKYIDETLVFARKEGYVETLFGRRRYIPELQSENFQLKSAGERMAINMPVQGTAADIMKMAMIKISHRLHELGTDCPDKNIRMILQVHDELVFEVKKGWEDEVVKMVKHEMEHVAELRVPITVQIGVGTRWGEIK